MVKSYVVPKPQRPVSAHTYSPLCLMRQVLCWQNVLLMEKPMRYRSHVEKARGGITTRKVTASRVLTGHIDWPGLAEVYCYETHKENTKTGQISRHKQYGITSLSPEVASAKDLIKLQRGHWTIENKVHWVRDTVFREDASQARTGSLPHVMAALRNTAMSVLRFNGYTKIAETLRLFASETKLAVNLIL